MNKNTLGIGGKVWFFLLPGLAIALHYSMSGILLYGFYSFWANVVQLTQAQFDAVSGWVEIFVNFVLILLFFGAYRWAFPRIKGETAHLPGAKETAMSLIVGAGISGVSNLWIIAAKNIPAFQESLSAMEAANQSIESGSAVQLLLTVAVAAPLLEELMFRGIVCRSLQKVLPVSVAIGLSAILFGAYHMNPVQAVYASFMGIVAGIIYYKTGRLIYPIMVHAANNFIGAMQSFLPPKTGSFLVDLFCLVMVIPTGVILYSLLKRNRETQEKKRKPPVRNAID